MDKKLLLHLLATSHPLFTLLSAVGNSIPSSPGNSSPVLVDNVIETLENLRTALLSPAPSTSCARNGTVAQMAQHAQLRMTKIIVGESRKLIIIFGGGQII